MPVKENQTENHEDITSLENLPKDLQDSFNNLCILAFCGMLEDRMHFQKRTSQQKQIDACH